MIALDMTTELAPLFWTVEAMLLAAVAWLVGMFIADLRRSRATSSPDDSLAAPPITDAPAADERRLAA
jgi:hypothetical protein